MDTELLDLKTRIQAARREIAAQLVLKGGKLANVFTGESQEGDVAIHNGLIVGVGREYSGKKEVDVRNKWIVPGLIDGHFHIESSMLAPAQLAVSLLVHGTTTIVSDPHEIANVMGLEGIRLLLRESHSLPFDIFFMAPSCVPATKLETAGAILKAQDLSILKDDPRVLGLAEVMNVPGVLAGNEDLLEKIHLFKDEILDGHCPALRGYDLQAYLAAGIRSDHEVTDRREGYEKIQSGMMLMIREGTSAKNLEELLPLVNIQSARRFCLVSDDLSAEDIRERGHLDFIMKKATGLGLDPAVALQLVTLNPAEYFGLKDRGAIAPGFLADLVVLKDLESFQVSSVYKEGRMIVDNGVLVNYSEERDRTKEIIESRPLNMAPIQPECFRIPYPGGKARVIELIPGQLITRLMYQNVKAVDGWVFSDTEADILKLCVVERHHASGRIGLGLVKGFGLKLGAMASSVAHDSHNVIAVGASDKEIFSAVEAVRLMGGGIAVVRGSETIAEIPLPIAGLLSHEPFETLLTKLQSVKKAIYNMGCKLEEPLMALSFLALPVIPELKLTDMGLVDVRHSEIVPLFLES